MKLLAGFKLTFLTPCFCAGADQRVAEIRPSAIRGELRWWFRCLGGTPEQEATVFGSTSGNGSSSSLLIRVSDVNLSDNYHSPTFISPNDVDSYQHYFLTAPNKNLNDETRMWSRAPDTDTKTKGVIRKESQIPPGSSFTLQILQNRNFPSSQSDELRALLDLTLTCFKNFGAIGFRKTRGFGAWFPDEAEPTRKELESQLEKLKQYDFNYTLGNGANASTGPFNQIETKLKGNKDTNTGYRLKTRYPASIPVV